MNRRLTRDLVRVLLLSGIVLVSASPALAEDAAAGKSPADVKTQAVETATHTQDARYRLRSDATSLDSESQEELLQRFEWKQIAKSGPAAGTLPAIGAGSGKAYVDFRDGLEAPKRHK